MYLRYYGLRELPFELTSSPRFLFLSPRHREALSTIEYGLSAAKAVTVLIGEAGTGKTTLLRTALESESCRNIKCVYLHNPTLTRTEFISMLSTQLELGKEACESKATMLTALETSLRTKREAGQIIALVVDEAQSLSYELLEEVRLLGNIETSTEKLLPLVLAGQPEFADRLNERELRQLKQRIALRCELKPLTLEETATYMASRIRAAGGEAARLFTREAVVLIHEHSGGTPRTISVICDNALVTAMALGRPRVDKQVVVEVCEDFDLDQVSATLGTHADESVSPQPAAVGQEQEREAADQPQDNEPLPVDGSATARPETARREATVLLK